MSVFNFDNYQEFGLFFKINSHSLLELSDNPVFHEKVNSYIKVFDHAKGGCGCNLNKRRKVADQNYTLFVSEFLTPSDELGLGDSVVAKVKSLLNNPTLINFKNAQTDETPFFSI